METNNKEWLNNATDSKKKSSKAVTIISLAILLLGLAGTGIYFFALDKGEEADNPPSLSFEGGQGFIFSGKYLKFEDKDIDDAEDKTFGTTVPSGIQVLYSNTNTNLQNVVDAIKPDKSLSIMFAYYNEDTRKFDVFPKGPYGETNLIDGDKLEQYEIPANRGFLLIASKTFAVSSDIKLYTSMPAYLSNTTGAKTYLKNLMNSYPSIGTKLNSNGDTVPDYDWRLMVGSPELIIEACGNRVKSIQRSVTPDKDGVQFAKFPTDSNEGYALWVLFKGDSGSCVSEEPGDDDTGDDDTGDDDTGDDDTGDDDTGDDDTGDDDTGDDSDDDAELDLSEEIAEANRLYSLTADYVKHVDTLASEASQIYNDVLQLVPDEVGLEKLSQFSKASAIAVTPGTVQFSNPNMGNLNTGEPLKIDTSNEDLRDKLQSGEIKPITELGLDKILDLSNFWENLYGEKNGLKLNLKNIKDRILRDKESASSELAKAQEFLNKTKNSTTESMALENLNKVKIAHDSAYGLKMNSDQNIKTMRQKHNQLKAVLDAEKAGGKKMEAVVDGIYNDEKFEISDNDIDKTWNEFTICMAENRDFPKCLTTLPNSFDGSVYKTKSEQLLNVCFAMRNSNGKATKDTYECVDSFVQLYIEDYLEIDKLDSSKILDPAKYLGYVRKINTTSSTSSTENILIRCYEQGVILDKQFYCDGNNWSLCENKINLKLENPSVEVDSSLNIKFTGNYSNFTFDKATLLIPILSDSGFENKQIGSDNILQNNDKIQFIFDIPEDLYGETITNSVLHLSQGEVFSNICTGWGKDIDIELPNIIIPQKDTDNEVSPTCPDFLISNDGKSICLKNIWVECNAENALKPISKDSNPGNSFYCTVNFDDFLKNYYDNDQTTKATKDTLSWKWVNGNNYNKISESYGFITRLDSDLNKVLTLVPEGKNPSIVKIMDDINKKYLFYCGPGFEGLISAGGRYACGFNGDTYKILDVEDDTSQRDYAAYGFLENTNKTRTDDKRVIYCYGGAIEENRCISKDNTTNNTPEWFGCGELNYGEQVIYRKDDDEDNDRYLCVKDQDKFFWYNEDDSGYNYGQYGVLPAYTNDGVDNENECLVREGFSSIESSRQCSKNSTYFCTQDNFGEQMRLGDYTYLCHYNKWEYIKTNNGNKLVGKFLYPYRTFAFFNDITKWADNNFWQYCSADVNLGKNLPYMEDTGEVLYNCTSSGWKKSGNLN